MANILSAYKQLGLFQKATPQSADYEAFLHLLPKFFIKTLYVGDTGIPRHIVMQWAANGLLGAEVEKEEGWKKFSIIDYYWLKVLEKMEGLKVPLALMQAAAHHFLTLDLEQYFEVRAENYLKNAKGEILAAKRQVVNQTKELFRVFFKDFSRFADLFFQLALDRDIPAAILVNHTGECRFVQFGDEQMDEVMTLLPALFHSDLYAINLNEIFNEVYLSKKVTPEHFQGLELLNQQEVAVINALRSTGIREVKVKLNQANQIEVISKVRHQEISEVKKKVHGLSKKGVVRILEMVYDEGENLRVAIETEQIKFSTNPK